MAGIDIKKGRRAWMLSGSLALLALAFLVWLVFFTVPATEVPAWVAALPLSDALCNSASALFALGGLFAIKNGNRGVHKALMLSALACSGLFLAGYVVFHHYHGETHFKGSGGLKGLYLCVLLSHVLLSFVVLPLLFATVAFAGLDLFERHKRLARWTLPLWLYVSISGVVVYVLLRSSY